MGLFSKIKQAKENIKKDYEEAKIEVAKERARKDAEEAEAVKKKELEEWGYNLPEKPNVHFEATDINYELKPKLLGSFRVQPIGSERDLSFRESEYDPNIVFIDHASSGQIATVPDKFVDIVKEFVSIHPDHALRYSGKYGDVGDDYLLTKLVIDLYDRHGEDDKIYKPARAKVSSTPKKKAPAPTVDIVSFDDDDDFNYFEPGDSYDFYVAGVRYGNRQELLRSDNFAPEGSGITLVPEPDNPHDPDAIKVVHPVVGHIGYVPADYTDDVRDYVKVNPKYHTHYTSREKGGEIFVTVYLEPEQ